MVSINQLIWKDAQQASQKESWKHGVIEKAEAFRILALLKESYGDPEESYSNNECRYYRWIQGDLQRVLFIDHLEATHE